MLCHGLVAGVNCGSSVLQACPSGCGSWCGTTTPLTGPCSPWPHSHTISRGQKQPMAASSRARRGASSTQPASGPPSVWGKHRGVSPCPRRPSTKTAATRTLNPLSLQLLNPSRLGWLVPVCMEVRFTTAGGG